MLLLTNMRVYLFIFILLIVGSFAAGGTTAFAQEPQCSRLVNWGDFGTGVVFGDDCDACPAPTGSCDPGAQSCNKWKSVCESIPGAYAEEKDDIRLTSTVKIFECQVPEESVSECSKLPQPIALGGQTAASGTCRYPGDPNCPDGVVVIYDGTETTIVPVANNSGGSGTAAPGKFSPMVGIPGISGSNYTLPQLINALYKLLIMLGAVIGVTKIAIAGVKYATTDIVSAKGDAKKDIQGVLTGLLILMAPYIILTIINENFTNLNVLNLSSAITGNTQTPSTNPSNPNPETPSNESATTDSEGFCYMGCTDRSTFDKSFKAECESVGGNTTITTNGWVCEGVTPPKTCPNFSGKTVPRCAVAGSDHCNDCNDTKQKCQPGKSPDNCLQWQKTCKDIPGAYIDESTLIGTDTFTCEVPEDFSKAGKCSVLAQYGNAD